MRNFTVYNFHQILVGYGVQFRLGDMGKTYNLKMIAFRDIAPCILIIVDRRLRGSYCLHHRPDDGGNMHL
jgi:hypothetical protein